MSSPKGKLIAIGGAEHKGTALEVDGFHQNNLNFFELGILRRVVEEAGSVNARIEVINPEYGNKWKRWRGFRRFGESISNNSHYWMKFGVK